MGGAKVCAWPGGAGCGFCAPAKPGSDSAAMVDYDAVMQGGKVRLMTIGYPDESGSHPFPAKTFVYEAAES